MNTERNCPSCGKPLPPDAPQGVCPQCLMQAGFGTRSGTGIDPEASQTKVPFEPPSVEEIARRFPRLEILGFIGRGGMGAVYQARQKELDRVVALKILPPGIGRDVSFAERFTREAKALAQLNHPNILTLYEFGQAEGLYFFLMEFVDGVNLRQVLESGRLRPEEALAIVPQICDALQYAHERGIVHRDIKPENILMRRDGKVKIADFGVAKIVAREVEGETTGAEKPVQGNLTQADGVLGTRQYMAPEQRERPLEVDHRADIYSLGVVFYQMLTGELPADQLTAPSKKVRIDVRLDEVVLRALEKEPEQRYQQASQFKTGVETISNSPQSHDARTNDSPAQPTQASSPVATIWLRRVFWLIAACLAIPFGLITLSLLAPQLARQGMGTTGGIGIIGVLLAIAGGLTAVLWKLGQSFRTAEPDRWNPWPRRLVGLGCAVVLAPILLFLVSVVAYRALEQEPGQSSNAIDGTAPSLPQFSFSGGNGSRSGLTPADTDEETNTSGRSEGETSPDVRKTTTNEWRQTLMDLNGAGWRQAFGVGQELAALPGDEGWQILKASWPRITNISARQQLLKSWNFASRNPRFPSNLNRRGHPRLLDVLDLGMRDRSPEVQQWAINYLKPIAFRDFAIDYQAYKAWYKRHESKPVEEVVVASLRLLMEELKQGDTSLRRERLTFLEENAGYLEDSKAVRESAHELGLPEFLAKWAGSEDPKIAAAALSLIGELKLEEAYLRRVAVPRIGKENPAEVRRTAIKALGVKGNEWAEPLLRELLLELVQEETNGARTIIWGLAQALADLGQPRSIPAMIAAIEADDTYDTIYGIGYFGLGEMTGVEYDADHDGAWWRHWWEKNKERFPLETDEAELPEVQPDRSRSNRSKRSANSSSISLAH